ncbi:hypothetical protein BKA70DRAFT_1231218 [Coprinopsis sp. MPI-PUGE-AT-0042]|nr:hypothetical protein BKA70DRAFT_1231218 [Coprinopsis sp. MPI-PUGE-AT-0042]
MHFVLPLAFLLLAAIVSIEAAPGHSVARTTQLQDTYYPGAEIINNERRNPLYDYLISIRPSSLTCIQCLLTFNAAVQGTLVMNHSSSNHFLYEYTKRVDSRSSHSMPAGQSLEGSKPKRAPNGVS